MTFLQIFLAALRGPVGKNGVNKALFTHLARGFSCSPSGRRVVSKCKPQTLQTSVRTLTKSQTHEGWIAVADDYDDGGFSDGNMERTALKRLLADIEAGRIDIVVVYKIDRLSRSLADFARMVEVFDRCGVSFSAVTQQINSATSMGRLMLNVLLSFAQFHPAADPQARRAQGGDPAGRGERQSGRTRSV